MKTFKLNLFGDFRLFGGDASYQRAETFAATHGKKAERIDDVDYKSLGLDAYYRDQHGQQFDYVVRW